MLIPENREIKVNKAIVDIKKMATNPSCKFILFYTWPMTNNYPIKHCYASFSIEPKISKDECCSPEMFNLEQELKITKLSYDKLAEANGLLKTNNSDKFYEIMTKNPEIKLQEDGGGHPSKYGSFLNACIFYQIISGKKAKDLKYTGEIESEIAFKLKLTAN